MVTSWTRNPLEDTNKPTTVISLFLWQSNEKVSPWKAQNANRTPLTLYLNALDCPFQNLHRKLLLRLVTNLIFNVCLCPNFYSNSIQIIIMQISFRGGMKMSRRLSIHQMTSTFPLLNFPMCVLLNSFFLPIICVSCHSICGVSVFYSLLRKLFLRMWRIQFGLDPREHQCNCSCNKCYDDAKAQMW